MEMFLFLSIALSIVSFISILLSPAPLTPPQPDQAEAHASHDSLVVDLEPRGMMKMENHEYSLTELQENYQDEQNEDQILEEEILLVAATGY